MKHNDVEFLLSQLLDGDLPPDQASDLRQRLAADPELAEQFRQFQQLDQRLSDMADDLPDFDWQLQRESISQQLERQALLNRPARLWPAKLIRWSAATAAAAAVILLAVLILPTLRPESSHPALEVAYDAPHVSDEPILLASSLVMPDDYPAARLNSAVSDIASPHTDYATTAFSVPFSRPNMVLVSIGAPEPQGETPAGWLFRDLY